MDRYFIHIYSKQVYKVIEEELYFKEEIYFKVINTNTKIEYIMPVEQIYSYFIPVNNQELAKVLYD